MCAAEPCLDAGPVEPARFAADEPADALNCEVKVVADATSEEYDVVCVIPALAEIFSPSANAFVRLSVPDFTYLI